MRFIINIVCFLFLLPLIATAQTYKYIGVENGLSNRRIFDKNKYVWRDNVENFILLKSNEEYFTDPVCKNGYFRGIETYNFVRDITSRFEQYKKKIKK